MKRIFLALCFILSILCFTACSNDEKEKITDMTTQTIENKENKSDVTMQTIESEENKIDTITQTNDPEDEYVEVKIKGSFTATVRGTFSDYCTLQEPQMALVTLFQSVPFALYLGLDMTSQLVVGESYVFYIEETNIGKIHKDRLNEYLEPPVVIYTHDIRIKEVAFSAEGNGGLECNNLVYEIVE